MLKLHWKNSMETENTEIVKFGTCTSTRWELLPTTTTLLVLSMNPCDSGIYLYKNGFCNSNVNLLFGAGGGGRGRECILMNRQCLSNQMELLQLVIVLLDNETLSTRFTYILDLLQTDAGQCAQIMTTASATEPPWCN